MSAKVIAFPRSPGGHDDRKPELKSLRASLVCAVREAAAQLDLKFSTKDDPLFPAQMIDQLIAEAKKRKITQDEIREALPERSVSWRHMERLRADHMVSPAEAGKKAGYLSRKVRPYVIVIETLARLLGRSTDDTLFEAFRDTTFLQKAGLALDDPAMEFAALIQEMGAWIAASPPFRAYFADASNYPGWFDATVGEFVAGSRMAIRSSYEGEFATWDYGSPLPTIPLFEAKRGRWKGSLLIERTPIADQNADRDEVAAMVSWRNAPRAIENAFAIDAEVALYTQIGLAIGPLSRADEYGPLWETRSRIRVGIQRRLCELTCDRSLTPLAALPEFEFSEYAGAVAVLLADGWHRVTGFGGPDWCGSPKLEPEIGHWYDYGLRIAALVSMGESSTWPKDRPEFCTHWDRVNGESNTQVVTLMTMEHELALLEDVDYSLDSADFSLDPADFSPVFLFPLGLTLLFDPLGPYRDRVPSEYRFSGDAQLLEKALFTGALEQGLSRSCAKLHTLLKRRLEERAAVMRRETEALLARWSHQNTEPNETT